MYMHPHPEPIECNTLQDTDQQRPHELLHHHGARLMDLTECVYNVHYRLVVYIHKGQHRCYDVRLYVCMFIDHT